MEDTLTVYKASQMCNVSSKSIINWIEAGHIKAYKTVGGHRRIKYDDLIAFMKRQGIPVPDETPANDRRKILVVDDEEAIRDIGMRLLEQAGFDVVGAGGEKTIEKQYSSARTSIERGEGFVALREMVEQHSKAISLLKGADVAEMFDEQVRPLLGELQQI